MLYVEELGWHDGMYQRWQALPLGAKYQVPVVVSLTRNAEISGNGVRNGNDNAPSVTQYSSP